MSSTYTRTSKQKAVFVATTVILGAAIGALAGNLLACVIVLRQAQSQVAQCAVSVAGNMAAGIRESRSILARMNTSAYGFCSASEINFFRSLVFQSRFLKESGRLRDGRIICSTTLGSVSARQPILRPDFVQSDGTRVYRNPPLFSIPGHVPVAIQLGSAYVVYNPFPFGITLGDLGNVNYAVTDVDARTKTTGQVFGELPPLKNLVVTRDVEKRAGGFIYVTRCSLAGSACVTAYARIADGLSAGQPMLIGLTGLAALAGALLGAICLFFYRRNKSLQHQLLRAIRRDELHVFYQPIVDIRTGRIVEAEALVRWRSGESQLVSPEVFVRIAEKSRFVGEITRLVIRHVLQDFASALRAHADFRINVNIAASDLEDPEFLPMLERALWEEDLLPGNLGIEITESYTARQQAAKETILQLRERGHHVAIDDFGTGYSSLAYLHDLSVDAIKIDKAFTRAIGTEAVTVSILPQILSMASQLGLHVVVEGIETQEQVQYFTETDMPIRAQGWFYGHPVSAEVFLRMLAENHVEAEDNFAAATVC